MMRVRAKQSEEKYVGYYGLVRRKPGDVFDLASPAHFSTRWMERVDEATPKTRAPGEATPEELGHVTQPTPTTLSEASQRGKGRAVAA